MTYPDKINDAAIKLVRDLAGYMTPQECHWEETDDPFIDNTMEDVGKMILEARKIVAALEYWSQDQ